MYPLTRWGKTDGILKIVGTLSTNTRYNSINQKKAFKGLQHLNTMARNQ